MLPTHERILAALGDPERLLLLLAVGVLAVCLELSRGGILPGIAGAVCIVLALGSPAARNFDAMGVVLVAGSFVCFVLEATIRTRGALTLAGGGMVLYGLLRIDSRMGWFAAIASALIFSILISFLLSAGMAARRSKLGILKNGDRVKP
jgi:membrane-bound serine protease (ClpP class)